MTKSNLSLKLKAIMYFIIILEAIIGLQFMFFHNFAETLFGGKIIDPEVVRLFGATILMVSYLFILGLKSDSVEVVRVLLKAYLVFAILIIVANYMNYTMNAIQPFQTYLSAGLLNIFLIALSIWGLIISKK